MGWAAARPWSRARGLPPPEGEESLAELEELATSAGARIVGKTLPRAAEPDPATLIGRGKVHHIAAEARGAGADLVIFDHDLTPTQLRNLEDALDLKVLDRTQLILDIFSRRARSREGQLQVELAQLTYLLPRLAGRGTLLSRLGGGIGTRGPGEQQLEFDRRRIRARIRKLREGIERVRSERALHRGRRRERQFLTVALIGYTNAGKSTLFNALTSADVATSGRMFATLDPTVRALPLPSRRRVLISDTVGFIRKLPPNLMVAFRATLEELAEADLLLHVTDLAHPLHEQQDAAVENLLEELDLTSVARIRVGNKVDLLEASERRKFEAGGAAKNGELADVAVSALTGEGLDALGERIDQMLPVEAVFEENFELPLGAGQALALLHRYGKVLSTRVVDGHLVVRARVSEPLRARLKALRSP